MNNQKRRGKDKNQTTRNQQQNPRFKEAGLKVSRCLNGKRLKNPLLFISIGTIAR
jgi:hypothetical protein